MVDSAECQRFQLFTPSLPTFVLRSARITGTLQIIMVMHQQRQGKNEEVLNKGNYYTIAWNFLQLNNLLHEAILENSFINSTTCGYS